MYETVHSDGVLAHRLRLDRVNAMIRQAQVIRDYTPGEERDREARKYVLAAQMERTLANITDDEKYRIFAILSFVMPAGAAFFAERPLEANETAPPEADDEILPDVACHRGCPSCEGGRMEPD